MKNSVNCLINMMKWRIKKMKFYRVISSADGTPRVLKNKNDRFYINGELVRNELYTEKEKSKICNNKKCFEVVDISKKKTYWFFGARFEINKGYNAI